ncbi:MAG: DsbA family protein [Thaumarchaeota archaeon]|nr:DsbA family protein [Nitrososphaerota archaeon]
MGKNKKEKPIRKSKAKFVGIGIITVIAAIIGILAASGGVDLNPNKTSMDTNNGSPVLGSEDAPVTIIEFGDYQCPFCQRWNLETKPLIEKSYIDSGQVKLIYIDFPIVGIDSPKAHASSYCADEQGLYWQYHDYLYKNQGHENDGWARGENLKNLASTLPGLDSAKFNKCLDSGKYDNRVKENKNVATKSGVRSTPTFIVIGPDGDGTQISGAQPYSVFQSVIEEKLNS